MLRLNRWVANYGDADLVGRDQDIAVACAFVDDAARHGGSLLVSGEAGVGKTADSQVPWGVDALGGAITEPA